MIFALKPISFHPSRVTPAEGVKKSQVSLSSRLSNHLHCTEHSKFTPTLLLSFWMLKALRNLFWLVTLLVWRSSKLLSRSHKPYIVHLVVICYFSFPPIESIFDSQWIFTILKPSFGPDVRILTCVHLPRCQSPFHPRPPPHSPTLGDSRCLRSITQRPRGRGALLRPAQAACLSPVSWEVRICSSNFKGRAGRGR